MLDCYVGCYFVGSGGCWVWILVEQSILMGREVTGGHRDRSTWLHLGAKAEASVKQLLK